MSYVSPRFCIDFLHHRKSAGAVVVFVCIATNSQIDIATSVFNIVFIHALICVFQFTDSGEAQLYYGLEGHLGGQMNQPGNEIHILLVHHRTCLTLTCVYAYVGMPTCRIQVLVQN